MPRRVWTIESLHTRRADHREDAPDEPLATYLVRLGRGHRLNDPAPLVVDLSGAREVRLGRGDKHSVRRLDAATLELRLDDPACSISQARLLQDRASAAPRLLVESLDPRNTCRINGEPADNRELSHGDILETGQTLWCLRRRPLDSSEGLLELAYGGGEIGPCSSVCLDLLGELRRARQLATSAAALLIQGEHGTGKEALAATVHRDSGRGGRFVAINCAAIPTPLVEHELFGHSRGAVAGVPGQGPGAAEQAHGGTLLLDEISCLPQPTLARLLRLLQDGTLVRLGESSIRRVDARVVVTSRADVDQLRASGALRGDLLLRLAAACVRLPPLRERREDLGLQLAAALEHSPQLARWARAPTARPEVLRALALYDWPFNIRELHKTVDFSLALCDGRTVTLDDLPEAMVRPWRRGRAVARRRTSSSKKKQ